MSSRKSKGKTMPIRLDEDVHEWIMALRDALDSSSASEALRHALMKAYPNIADIAQAAQMKEEERREILERLLSEAGESE